MCNIDIIINSHMFCLVRNRKMSYWLKLNTYHNKNEEESEYVCCICIWVYKHGVKPIGWRKGVINHCMVQAEYE